MTVFLDLKEQSYNIHIEKGVINKAGQLLDLNRKVMIITDSGVPKEYARKIAEFCSEPYIMTIEQGEASKNFDNLKLILAEMLDKSFTRHDCIVAVGGGVVGDLSGFAASCYMRGIDFYNIPTTLLSQVDSSIGGKTAVNFMGYKNTVGAFYQPKCVLIDPDTLLTLEKRQVNSGLAEVIKMAMTHDGQLFDLLCNCENLFGDIEEIITRSLLIKRDVVQKDPKEQGLRKVLNFGHTVGHAIESFYEGEKLHGECVAMGILPMCGDEIKDDTKKLLKKYGLLFDDYPPIESLIPFLLHDKKMQSDKVSAVFVNEIGSFEIAEVSPQNIINRLEKMQ